MENILFTNKTKKRSFVFILFAVCFTCFYPMKSSKTLDCVKRWHLIQKNYRPSQALLRVFFYHENIDLEQKCVLVLNLKNNSCFFLACFFCFFQLVLFVQSLTTFEPRAKLLVNWVRIVIVTIKLWLVSWNSLIGKKGLSRFVECKVGYMIITSTTNFIIKRQTDCGFSFSSQTLFLLCVCISKFWCHKDSHQFPCHPLFYPWAARNSKFCVMEVKALKIYYPSFSKLNICPASHSSLQ